jgi:hypothetical protein
MLVGRFDPRSKAMRALLAIVAAVVLVLGLAGTVAADESLEHTGRFVFVAGGDVEVAADEQADAVIVIGGDATVAGTVNALVVVNGTATLTGATLESLTVVGGTAELDAGTTVTGDVYHLNSTIDAAEGAAIGGDVRDVTTDVGAFAIFLGAAAIILWIGFAIAMIVAGLLFAGLAARQVRTATALISQSPGMTFLAGLLAVVVPPIVAILALATIVGIPAGLGLLFVIWPALAFVGYLVASIWLGEWLLYRNRPEHERPERPYLAVVVGLAVAFVIGLVPLVTPVISLFGLGAVVRAAWRTLRSRPAPVAPAIPQVSAAS